MFGISKFLKQFLTFSYFLLNLVPFTLGQYYSDSSYNPEAFSGIFGPDGVVGEIDMRKHRKEDEKAEMTWMFGQAGVPFREPEEEVGGDEGGVGTGNETKPEIDYLTNSDEGKMSIEKIQKAYLDNYNKIIESATSKLNSALNSSGVGVTSCTSPIAKEALSDSNCPADDFDGWQCYMKCLLKSNSQLAPLSDAINDALLHLCLPIHTAYTIIFKDNGLGFGHLKTYRKFLEGLKVKYEDFGKTIPILSNALMVAMIKHIKTPQMPLRKTIMILEMALRARGKGNPGGAPGENPACKTVDKTEAAKSFANAFLSDASMVDIITPGYNMFNIVSKYMSARVTQEMAVLREGLRLFTGTTASGACGVGGKSSGGSTTCDDLGRYPIPGFPIPPPIGGDQYTSLINPVCSSEALSIFSPATGNATVAGGAGNATVTNSTAAAAATEKPSEE